MKQRTPSAKATGTRAETGPAGPRLSRVLYKLDKDGRREDTPAEISLSGPVRTYLGPVRAEVPLGFRCLAIGAVRGDGIPLARQEVEDNISRMNQGGQMVTLAGKPVEGALPNLFEIVSRRIIIAAARKAGAPGIPRRLRPWVTVAVIIAAIVITATLSLLTPLGGAKGGGLASVVHPLSLLSVFGIAALGVVVQLLINFPWRDKHREPPEHKVADWVAVQQNSRAYENFIGRLTAKFGRFNGLRCLVVDDFSLLDRPTQDVLIRYVRDYATDRPNELWVVFDPSDEAGRGQFAASMLRLRREARLTGGHELPAGVKRVQLFELAPLSPEQKNELAVWAGHPERAGYRTLDAIVAEKDDTLPAYFEEQIPPTGVRQDPGRYDAFELLYLLSLATVVGGSIEWPEEALLNKLAVQKQQRSRVLRQILTGSTRSKSSPSKDNLRARLGRMREDFSFVVTTPDKRGPDAYLSVSAEVGNVLGRLSGRFKLADAGLGHLFWALWRNDAREATGDDPFWLSKASNHLLQAASPHDYADQFGADTGPLARRLFSAILEAVGDSLRLSQPKLVPRLLQRAADLLEDDDQKKPLLDRARDAYAVLADDTILRILLDLRSTREPEQVSESATVTATSALALFLQATAGAAHLKTTPSAFEAGHSLADLKGDAELRGSWLALSLQPFVTPQQAHIWEAIARARVTVPLVVNAVLSARIERPTDRKVADLVNLSIGLWCWALGGSTPEVTIEVEGTQQPQPDISDALETAYLVADDLYETYMGDGSHSGGNALDLAREGLTEELLTVTAATALFVKQRWQDLDEKSTGTIDEVLNASMDKLGLQVPAEGSEAAVRREILDALSERMSLLQVTWKALGYEQLATMLNVRRIQLTALLTPPTATPARARAAEHVSVEDRDQADLLGLLINLAIALQDLPSVEAAAEALVYGVTAFINGEMAEEFSVQLCALAIGYAHSYETSLQPVVRYLLCTSEADPGGTRLDWLLASIDEKQLVDATLEILNVAGRASEDEPRLMTALRHRANRVSDEEIRSLLEEQFNVRDLVRKQVANEPIDVDEVLDMWVGHENSASYPYVLYRLVQVNDIPLPPRLRGTIAGVVENFQSYLSQSGILLLGENLASRFSIHARSGSANPPEVAKNSLVDMLRIALGSWSENLRVETNISILEFLHAYDARPDEYESQLAYWREEKLRLIEERDLPHLISAGRYVLLMLEYLETLREYGLTAVTEKGETPLSLSGKTVSKAELAQLSRAAAHPFLTIGGKPVLNSQFLFGAQKLFQSNLSKDAQYDDIRYEFNDAAKSSMQELFTFLIDLDKIPKSIRGILERHERLVRSRLAALTSRDPSLFE